MPRCARQSSHARRKSPSHLIGYRTIEPNTGLRRTTHRRLGVACGLIAAEPSNDHTLVNSFEPCTCRALSLGLHVAEQATASRSVHSSAPRRSLLVRPWGLLGGGRRRRAVDYCATFTSWSPTIALNLLLGADGSKPTAHAWPSCRGARRPRGIRSRGGPTLAAALLCGALGDSRDGPIGSGMSLPRQTTTAAATCRPHTWFEYGRLPIDTWQLGLVSLGLGGRS